MTEEFDMIIPSVHLKWKDASTLFDALPDTGAKGIVLAEFGAYGLEMIDFDAYAHKILDGKAMHIESFINEPTCWMDRERLTAYLENIEHEDGLGG